MSAPQAPCAIVGIEPPERSPAGPWLGLVAAGPGVRALAPVEGVADITVTLATEAGRLVTFAPLLVTDREALAGLETDVRPDAARPAPVR